MRSATIAGGVLPGFRGLVEDHGLASHGLQTDNGRLTFDGVRVGGQACRGSAGSTTR